MKHDRFNSLNWRYCHYPLNLKHQTFNIASYGRNEKNKLLEMTKCNSTKLLPHSSISFTFLTFDDILYTKHGVSIPKFTSNSDQVDKVPLSGNRILHAYKVQKREISLFASNQRGRFNAKPFCNIHFAYQHSNSGWNFENDEIFLPYNGLKLFIWCIKCYHCTCTWILF